MKLNRTFLALILIATFATSGEAGKENGDLTLYKDPILEFESARLLGACPGLRSWKENRNAPDFRNDLRNFHCQGRFSLTLEGSKDKVVTLFAGFNYKKEQGYLVVRKLDDKKVWIPDLMNLPTNQWVTMTPEDGYDSEFGSFEIFFRPSPNFDQKLASMKWGQWWEGGIPN
jgi:hypothetical protein